MKNEKEQIGTPMTNDERFVYAKEFHTLKAVVYLKNKFELYNGQRVQCRRTLYGFPTSYNSFLKRTVYSGEMELRKLRSHLHKIQSDVHIAIIYTADNREVLRWREGTVYKTMPYVIDRDDDNNDSLRLV